MGFFAAIVEFLASLLGSSAFGDASHKLFTEMGEQHDITVYDEAVKTAASMLEQGASFAQAMQHTVMTHKIAESHAAVVVAAAHAQLNKPSTPTARA